MSLEQALSELWDEFTPGGARYKILVLGKPKALKPAIKEQLYLIGREAVLNALRHSGAAAIEAEVEYSARRLRDREFDRELWILSKKLTGIYFQTEDFALFCCAL